jgi:sugar phosphate isomerase/epimerase
MGGYENFYGGADYGLDPDFEGSDTRAYMPAGQFGLTTDARSANQLKEVSRQLNTGAKTIEMGSISPEVFESIPKEHFKELARLRQLVGAELTVHAPVLEATGFSKAGWDEASRMQTQRQLQNVVDKAHELDEKGNVVITFHSSAALPEGVTRVIENGKEKITEIIGIDERTGQAVREDVKASFLEGERKSPEEYLEARNEKDWSGHLRGVNFNISQGTEIIGQIKDSVEKDIPDEKERQKAEKSFFSTYNKYIEGKNVGEMKILEKLPTEKLIREVERGEIYLRDGYDNLKQLFDSAYAAASPDDKKILEAYKKEAQPVIEAYKKDHAKIAEFAEVLRKGIHTLHRINTPQIYKPLDQFMRDKAATTYSNLALDAYKKYGDNAPIISIENPPAGGGMSRGEDLKLLIKKTQEKFVEEAVKQGKSKSEAKEAAEKLIGATWDVGHINMLRKFGYGEEHIKEETKKIAPLVKHIHLSDNFGMEHTELPMGMGNVPKGILDEIAKKGKNVKKILETIQWYQHFQASPLPIAMAHYNSPIYAADGSGYWTQQNMGGTGSYLSGYGMNPDFHHQVYGGSFTGLPVELGGQSSGRSRVSGTPMD